ncbi:serine-threonine protein kinase [Mycolicibacterium conceptionense]|uniref:Serine-threonine protein kinase n=1 Tax=Mycolicibacterium conceptionense TaxID=451644 RepID=A0A0U1DAZ3_9MYCO|nr:serine-threonine protein kinase [Mycolicibacterium conceptionense]
MAKPKKTAKYDLKAADRKRNLWVQIGLTAVVVLFAVGLVLYIVMTGHKRPASGEARAVHVAAPNVITKEGTSEPKVTLSLFEDFLCPACGHLEQQFGPTINKLIDSGAVAVDYHMVAILDKAGNGYSSRAGGAAYCIADESVEAFRRFHSALFTPGIQPEEAAVSTRTTAGSSSWPARPVRPGTSPTASPRGATWRWCRAWLRPPVSTRLRPSNSTARNTTRAPLTR